MNPYEQLGSHMRRKGIDSFMQHDDQIVISNQNPAYPNSNSFWVTRKEGGWYIGTWLPAIYQVPLTSDIADTCESIFQSSATALYTIDQDLALRLRLRRLSDEEMQQLGFG